MRSDPPKETVLSAWGAGRVIRPLAGGARNSVWLVEIGGVPRVAKSTNQSEAALAWLAVPMAMGPLVGLRLPRLLRAGHGGMSTDGWTVETFAEGRPAGSVRCLDAPLGRFHRLTVTVPQRPGAVAARDLLTGKFGQHVDLRDMPPMLRRLVLAAFRPLAHDPGAVVHGDVHPENVLLADGKPPALVDWDETRVDLPEFDLWVIRRQRPVIYMAWEVAVSWKSDRAYARRMAPRLFQAVADQPVRPPARSARIFRTRWRWRR